MTTGHPDRTRPPPADDVPNVLSGVPAPHHADAPVPHRAAAADGAPHGPGSLLRAERVRVAHWRRLVRARIDLAAAALALPGSLGDGLSSWLATVDLDEPPSYLALLDAVSTGGPQGEIDRLEALRDLDDRLAGYERTVARALHAAAAPDQARWGRLSA